MAETDHKRMLEMAAKAAGKAVKPGAYDATCGLELASGVGYWWNPLKNDGDALRLAERLKLSVMYGTPGAVQVSADDGGETCTAFAMEQLGNDGPAATRIAIVCAAAQLGES